MMIRTRKIPATDTTGAMIEALEVGGTHSSRTAYDYAAVDPFHDAAQRLAGDGWDVERRDQSGSGRVYQFFVGTPKPKPTAPRFVLTLNLADGYSNPDDIADALETIARALHDIHLGGDPIPVGLHRDIPREDGGTYGEWQVTA